ncbi:AAA domain-containing protein, putative AbiEii toxin, Type IV TA system [Methanobrevibacter olleyae]|uniref:AAA domain-containing protein, putative AbiEii toxin, Type IV TA system n=1 Tax=Methanobrevibacter olleyae TaxID=294671 RepID=A0A1I4H748_METOL|nr:AAA family ATPase [Methanobrevibacter olleyae]SFL38074.1 AAA domain-containing protein, putative AbiEii toxin, Type IV TA system [Methanobrevibacter olleyae]
MINNLNFKLNNVGCLANADMDIGKINIIGGLNSTGKSTSSKILYSFLRSNSKVRKDLVDSTLTKEILGLTVDLLNFNRPSWDDDKNNYEEIKDKFMKIMDKLSSRVNKSKRNEEEDKEYSDIIGCYNEIKRIYEEKFIIKEDYKKILDKSFSDVEKLVKIYNDNGDELFKTLMNQLIKREFGKNLANLNNVRLSGEFNNNDFNYNVNIKDSEFNMSGWFILEDVFYLDSFSIFDGISHGGLQNTEHIQHVFSSLDDDNSNDWADEILNDDIIELENKIMEITGGTFAYDDNNIIFSSLNQEFLMKNTSSGIKQIGIIQMLLNNRKLKENSFLIMDEPEVNLHPEWQVKFAEIITLLAKDLNVTLYINSHSPLFIEAIRTYCEKNGLLDETNFYLTFESEISGKYDIKYIPNDDLNIIYNTLGKPYELLSMISIENEFDF